MKAAMIEKNGGPEVLIHGDLPDPIAGPGEVVVDIHAASINAADWKVRADEYGGLSLTFPCLGPKNAFFYHRPAGEMCERSAQISTSQR